MPPWLNTLPGRLSMQLLMQFLALCFLLSWTHCHSVFEFAGKTIFLSFLLFDRKHNSAITGERGRAIVGCLKNDMDCFARGAFRNAHRAYIPVRAA